MFGTTILRMLKGHPGTALSPFGADCKMFVMKHDYVHPFTIDYPAFHEVVDEDWFTDRNQTINC